MQPGSECKDGSRVPPIGTVTRSEGVEPTLANSGKRKDDPATPSHVTAESTQSSKTRPPPAD